MLDVVHHVAFSIFFFFFLKEEAGMRSVVVSGGLGVGKKRWVHPFVYALPKGELARHGIMLESKRTRRKPRKPLGERKTGPIIGMRSIHDRPADVADRKVPGHWEGDLIIGRAGKTAAATLVERTTRFTAILGLPLGKDSPCLLYTYDAADERSSVDLGGRRIIKKQTSEQLNYDDKK